MVLSRSTESSASQTAIEEAKMSQLSVQQEASTSMTRGLFSGATIGKFDRCIFNFNVPGSALCSEDGETLRPVKRKKRIAIISNDSDSD